MSFVEAEHLDAIRSSPVKFFRLRHSSPAFMVNDAVDDGTWMAMHPLVNVVIVGELLPLRCSFLSTRTGWVISDFAQL